MTAPGDPGHPSADDGQSAGAALPPTVAALLDGTDLASKVGETILLVAAGADGRPRVALLSVGEVLAATPAQVDLALYPRSRTTQALTAAGRGLLVVVADGTTYKIEIEVEPAPGGGSLALFRGAVVAVDDDRVGYATTTHGIRYALLDETMVLRRWQQQVEQLRKVRE